MTHDEYWDEEFFSCLKEGTQLIQHLVPQITKKSLTQLEDFCALFAEWNKRVNLVSRRDMPHFFFHHIVHSLLLVPYMQVQKGDWVLDFGTGGGLPGIPLAICYPEVEFTLIDSIEKKMVAVRNMVHQLGLQNVLVRRIRGEELTQGETNECGMYRWVVSRAVASVQQMWKWSSPLLRNEWKEQGGLLLLKGGDLQKEISTHEYKIHVEKLLNFINPHKVEEEYYKEKYLVHLWK